MVTAEKAKTARQELYCGDGEVREEGSFGEYFVQYPTSDRELPGQMLTPQNFVVQTLVSRQH
jgi:hypothetical protein